MNAPHVTHFAYLPQAVNDECPICGADIDPSSSFPWHFEDEDCRAVRDPIVVPTIIARAGVSESEV